MKYRVVERVVSDFEAMKRDDSSLAGQKIVDLVTVDGVRVVAEDGTNRPELIVVVESPVSSDRRRQMIEVIDAVLRSNPEVSAYNQTF